MRSASEHKQACIKNALNIPFHDIQQRIGELDKDTEIWVHCASGYRASVVASMLHAHGFDVALINDDIENAPSQLIITG